MAGFGIGANAFMQGAMRGYGFAKDSQRRNQEDEMRGLELEQKRTAADREKAYAGEMTGLGEELNQRTRVQSGTDELGNPTFTQRAMNTDEQLEYAERAASIGAKYMKLTPEQMLNVRKTADSMRNEGEMEALKRVHFGDTEGGIEAFNRVGRNKISADNIAGIEEATFDAPGGIKMPTRIIRLNDGTTINTAERMMRGMAYDKLVDLSARKSERDDNHAYQTGERVAGEEFQSGQLDKRLNADRQERAADREFRASEGAADRSLRANEGAADRATRERLTDREIADRREGRKDQAQERREAAMPNDVRTAEWYVKATPEQRQAYDEAVRRGDSALVKDIAGKLAGNLAYSNQPEKVVRDATVIAGGLRPGRAPAAAPGGFGLGQKPGATPAPQGAQRPPAPPSLDVWLEKAQAANPTASREDLINYYQQKYGAR